MHKVPPYAFWGSDIKNLRKRIRRRLRGGKLATGRKVQYIPGAEGVKGSETPYFANERKRRRRRGKAAKQARKLNRA